MKPASVQEDAQGSNGAFEGLEESIKIIRRYLLDSVMVSF